MEAATNVWAGLAVFAAILLLAAAKIWGQKKKETVIDPRGRPEDRIRKAEAELEEEKRDGA